LKGYGSAANQHHDQSCLNIKYNGNCQSEKQTATAKYIHTRGRDGRVFIFECFFLQIWRT